MKAFSSITLLELAFLTLFFVTGCEITPYDVPPKLDACTGVDIQSNIQKLKQLELSNAGHTQFKVAIVSDSHENTLSLEKAVARINQRSDIDFVMVLGDITDDGIKDQYEYACKNLRRFTKPVLTVIGNHDSKSNGKELWTNYFGPYDYSFSYLGTKFIAYNDNHFEFPNAPDQGFIQREAKLSLGEVRNHTIAASHVQPISEVHDAQFQKDFLKMLADAQIHMTIHGHRHDFYYDKDTYGNDHHIVSWTKEGDWSVMTVEPSRIIMENCTNDHCAVVSPH